MKKRSRTYYFRIYRQFLKNACERCGSTEHLLIHHRDEDYANNEEPNLETMCKRCHQLHHNCIAKLPRGPRGPRTIFPQACEWCGEKFTRHAGHTTQRFCSRSCAMRKRMAH